MKNATFIDANFKNLHGLKTRQLLSALSLYAEIHTLQKRAKLIDRESFRGQVRYRNGYLKLEINQLYISRKYDSEWKRLNGTVYILKDGLFCSRTKFLSREQFEHLMF